MAPVVAASAAASQALRDREILEAMGTAAAALSLACSSFIVLCYLLFRELHKFSFKLVYFLAISDMFCSLFTIMGGPSNAFYCFAHDYSAHFFCVASFLWTTTIAFTLHRTVVKHKTDVEEFGSIFHLYVWVTKEELGNTEFYEEYFEDYVNQVAFSTRLLVDMLDGYHEMFLFRCKFIFCLKPCVTNPVKLDHKVLLLLSNINLYAS